jgi:hypothetical protein
MYAVDDQDRVIELRDMPGHNAGAPEPVILATGLTLLVAYRAEGDTDDLVVLQFERVHAHYFGSPNDEGFIGHPLAVRGLRPYGSFEVVGSSWIRLLERRNRVRHRHDPDLFSRARHFILTFYDNTFECVAENFSVKAAGRGGVRSWVVELIETARRGSGLRPSIGRQGPSL